MKWVVLQSVENNKLFLREERCLLKRLSRDGIQHYVFDESKKIQVIIKFIGDEYEAKKEYARYDPLANPAINGENGSAEIVESLVLEENDDFKLEPLLGICNLSGITPPLEHEKDDDLKDPLKLPPYYISVETYDDPVPTTGNEKSQNDEFISIPNDHLECIPSEDFNYTLDEGYEKTSLQTPYYIRSEINEDPVANVECETFSNEESNHSEYVPSEDLIYTTDEDYECIPSEDSETRPTVSAYSFEENFIPNKCPKKPVKENQEKEILKGGEQEQSIEEVNIQIDVTERKSMTKKRVRRKIHCPFCETDVTNFARHIMRNHKSETEVAAFAWRDVKDPERRRQLELLSKRGNFIKSSEGDICPVRKPIFPRNNDEYTTCTKCFGNFSSSSFYKHAKICHFKDGTNSRKPRYYHQIAGQNLILRHLKVDENLQKQVFPRMKPDNVSLVAKSDGLILKFGARYLNSHRAAHFVPVTSRKMRELAKLLIVVKANVPSVKSFLDLLQPRYFKDIVAATKLLARFNSTSQTYESPTFAMNISTSIKECCDIAILELVNRKEVANSVNTAEVTSELRSLRDIIEKHWRYEISTQAGNDLREKSWNKITLIPLAEDLAQLKKHLQEKGLFLVTTLEADDHNEDAFYNLVEIVYCRLLLLNRRRPGELQRLTIDLFQMHVDKPKPNTIKEFAEIITPTERVLLNKFKRIVLRGKRGRGVPVLFCPEVYKQAKLILRLRDNFINQENRLFFVRKNSDEPLRGYQVLAKIVRKAGVKFPEAITCTKLRKHLATMSQLFSMSPTDVEQLASFMGHTVGVHKNVYRLPDDVYQTAKIAKLLVLMEKGQARQYKNKTLDEIDIHPEEQVDNYADDELDFAFERTLDEAAVLEDHAPKLKNQNHNAHPNISQNNVKKTNEKTLPLERSPAKPTSPPSTKKRVLVPWTEKQKKAAKTFFEQHIDQKRAPKRQEVEELISQTGQLFNNKSWKTIKVYIQNLYSKK